MDDAESNMARHDGPPSNDAVGSQRALEIYQSVMDKLNEAYLQRNFEAMSGLTHLPLSISTFDSRLILRTVGDLCSLMDGFTRMLDRHSVTTYLRVCIAARFVDDDTIDGTHESHVLNGMRYIEPRFPSRCILRNIDGTWKIATTESAIEDDAFKPSRWHDRIAHTAVPNRPSPTQARSPAAGPDDGTAPPPSPRKHR